MKILVIVAFIAIIGSLAGALFFMMRKPSSDEQDQVKSRHMARALALRVGFSILLFLAVLISHQMGWIQPTGLPAGR